MLQARQLRLSRLFAPTSKAAAASVVGAAGPGQDGSSSSSRSSTRLPASADLLLRGGFLRPSVAAGYFALLPLGLRVLHKVEALVHQELGAVDCQALSLPCVSSLALWRKSGRWSDLPGAGGREMFRLQDRRGAEFCLAPTHEEDITNLVANEVTSYRQLPLRLYQIGKKYRDELRPRAGLLRAKEFIMKDLYTFDRTEAEARATYAEIRGAYDRIFERLGLPFHTAEADTGNIGGSTSHEYHYPSPVGEDTLLACRSCGYSANEERARARRVDPEPLTATPLMPLLAALHDGGLPELARQLREGTPALPTGQLLLGWRDVAEDASDSNVTTGQQQGESPLAFVCLRAGATPLPTATIAQREPALQGLTLRSLEGAEALRALEHYASNPNSPPALVFVQDSAVLPEEAEGQVRALGARASVHLGTCTLPKAGDVCTNCATDTPLHAIQSIEVGHTFLLGTKYSAPLGASFRDPERSPDPIPIQMGCYGIGVSRLLAAVVECSHDARGMRWPRAIAPYSACIIPFPDRAGEGTLATAATALHEALVAAGHDVLLDDRAGVRPGAKMKDADLIGYPYAILVGKEFLATGRYEVQARGVGSAPRSAPLGLDQAGILSLLSTEA